MSQYIIDTRIENGHLELNNIPLDNSDVRLYIVQKTDLSKMSFNNIRSLTDKIKGNLSDDINKERDER